MLIFSRSSTPALSRAARHVGFLNTNRRLLALGAVAASGMLLSMPSLPAAAETVAEDAAPVVVPSQSFVAPAIVAVPVLRDGFGITAYSVVQWPVPSSTPISSGFGYRDCAGCTENHTGIDFTPGTGYPVQAVADGIVTEASYTSDYGVHVVISHLIDGVQVSSLYAHMQDGSLAVAVGDSVARGQQLGTVGETGIATGPHLHFAIITEGTSENGTMIDPYPWLVAHVNA